MGQEPGTFLCKGAEPPYQAVHNLVSSVPAAMNDHTWPRVHNKGREESVEHVCVQYNSSESNMTSCLAHVTMPNAKTSKVLLTIKNRHSFL